MNHRQTLTCLLVTIAVLLASCASTPGNTLIGRWQLAAITINGETQVTPANEITIIEFFDDGTINIQIGDERIKSIRSNYRVEGQYVYIEGFVGGFMGEKQEFTLENDALTLTYQGATFTYKRIK